MIAWLEGVVRSHVAAAAPSHGTYRVVVDVAGVGYLVTTSSLTRGLIVPGKPAALLIHTRVSETAIALFGFASVEELRLFEILISVDNVGPSTALALLSARTSVAEVVDMIANADARALIAVNGIGKKKADVLIAQLAERLRAERAEGLL